MYNLRHLTGADYPQNIFFHMNIEIDLLSVTRNWYPWEFQQIIGRPDLNYKC